MAKTYSRFTFFFCKRTMSKNGLARSSHLRKHVREGFLTENRDRRGGVTFDLTDHELWNRLYPRDEISV